MRRGLISIAFALLMLAFVLPAHAQPPTQTFPGMQPPGAPQPAQILPAAPQPAQVPPGAQATPVPDSEKKVEQEIYVYVIGGRRDPFLSLLEIPAAGPNGVPPGIKTPPEEADLSQFRLIAIAWVGNTYQAVVGLPDGKYYNLKEGVKAGLKGGSVKKIYQDRVVFKEFRFERGQTKEEEYILKLRNEEGE